MRLTISRKANITKKSTLSEATIAAPVTNVVAIPRRRMAKAELTKSPLASSPLVVSRSSASITALSPSR